MFKFSSLIIFFYFFVQNIGVSALVSDSSEIKPLLETKEQALKKIRDKYGKQRPWHSPLNLEKSKEYIELLDENGVFMDMKKVKSSSDQNLIESHVLKAFSRLKIIAETYRSKKDLNEEELAVQEQLFKSFIHYAKIEQSRPNTWVRFHASCFSIPSIATTIYFCFLDLMTQVEENKEKDSLIIEVNKALKDIGYQSWTQPYRNDKTDKNIVSVDRFRNHVWWVGGNALDYRPVLESALIKSSIPMIDVLYEVSQKSLSVVSQTTLNTAFWNEGFTSDGMGWGHGKQGIVWGYPLHGSRSALKILDELNNTPWSKEIKYSGIKSIFNYLRGSSWCYYKGYIPPVYSRNNMTYTNNRNKIPSLNLAQRALRLFDNKLTDNEKQELKEFIANADGENMKSYPKGQYIGSRYFYNNDDLVIKNNDFYWLINMASSRVNGMESSNNSANYNYYTCDGQTILLRKGDEAIKALGGFNLTAFPGVTARQGEDSLKPIINNWSGFNSKYNFAAGATFGGENAVAGFIFEKNTNSNSLIKDVIAYKSWFVFGDLMLCLGAGIDNLDSSQKGDIWTTIDQTLWHSSIETSQGNFEHDSKSHKKIFLQNSIALIKQAEGFSYAILPKHTTGKISLIAEKRKTKWNKISEANINIKNKPEFVDILQLYINHGRRVKDGKYAYFVYAGDVNPEEYFSNMPVEIISNTKKIQAVSHPKSKTISAVFYDKKSILKYKTVRIETSAPCVLLIEYKKGFIHIAATDAEMNQKLNELVIKINNISYEIPLPQEPYRGKPAK